ncbi:DNA replication terminus site-binding protein [Catenovulum sp. 2E275]|uniref:DNA replication terminus site-binding protein n=1 Tax=Catenovulum sp. 2E275 TaxID=2980497 RepID=UPI0021D09961|nr:DNA replication terminus site-binding protein [Catenovulum sp. 2E275]MCU4677661.1 DNA replication terminus site-binding protein [Catenovulum sp. 2E275]
MSVKTEHIVECKQQFNQLKGLIELLNLTLEENSQFVQAHCYQIGQLNPANKTSPILQAGELELAQQAYLHFKLDAGDVVKYVVRYPGIISINQLDTFEKLDSQLIQINLIKAQLSEFISRHGKPAEFKTAKGDLQYVRNDLIYHALPMVNHGMLKRQITRYCEPMDNASFGWNIDFNHESITDIEAYKNKLHGRLMNPPSLVTLSEWQKSIDSVINKIDRLVNDGIQLKIIRPKPVEPKMYVSFADNKKTIRPKLPVIAYAPDGHVKLKKILNEPKPHPIVLTKSGKYEYEKLSPYLYLYACRIK